MRAAGGYFRLLARRLLNGLQFFTGGVRWLLFLPAAILLVPPALILPFLDSLDRDRNFTLGYICTARKRADTGRKRKTLDGVIVVDKPEGWTSHDVVARCAASRSTKKIGHLGTLDPIATGVLPLVIGGPRGWRSSTRAATRSTRAWCASAGPPTRYDRAGEPTSDQGRGARSTAKRWRRRWSRSAASSCRRPPAVSAKKVDGRARTNWRGKNVAVELEPVRVHVYELTRARSRRAPLRDCARTARAAPTCGRSRTIWARRWAAARTCRNCGGWRAASSKSSRRARIAATGIAGRRTSGWSMRSCRRRNAARLPSVFVDDLTAAQIRNGRNFPASPFRSQPASKYVKAVTRQGDLVAIGEAVLPNLYHPVVVL